MNFIRGDWRFFWPENIGDYAHLPSSWDSSLNTGLGMPSANTMWITAYLNFTAYIGSLGVSWEAVSLIFWFLPIILISFFSAWFLYKNVISQSKLHAILAGILYTTNTYFLMIFLGGQVGVAFAYAFAPLIFASLYKSINKPTLQQTLITGLVISLQILFDPRITFVTLLVTAFYFLITFQKKYISKDRVIAGIIVLTEIIALHSYWLVPLLSFRSSLAPTTFGALAGIDFFSFAKFENSISLLHPNWPENIFGKVYFMRPEFLILPCVAFMSLFLIDTMDKKRRTFTIFFVLLAVLGAFLAKGTNMPFGELYRWLFYSVPGFSVFRDPTKFYILVSISYAVLIPLTLEQSKKITRLPHYIPVIVFLIIWIFALRDLPQSFHASPAPADYSELKDYIHSDKTFYRTLWIPQLQRYRYFSNTHPSISAEEFFGTGSRSAILKKMHEPRTYRILQNSSVKYVVVPFDSESEIFLKDRHYDEQQYKALVQDLKSIPYLTEGKHFGKIALFEVPDNKNQLWFANQDDKEKSKIISSQRFHTTSFVITLNSTHQNNRLVFSESYSPFWIVRFNNTEIKSQKFEGMNSFSLPKGRYTISLTYKPQNLVYIFLVVSTLSFVAVCGVILFLSYRKNT